MSNSSSLESITYVKTSDLLKIVDALYCDQMEYARIAIHYDDNSETLDGSVHIAGITNIDSSEPSKHYHFIEAADLPNYHYE